MRPTKQIVNYHIAEAKFVTSAVRPTQFPGPDRPEIAFAGRSNVGKSSLLNRLLKRRKLARTGNTPGRTQTLNFFDVNGELYFVDLPGFGYAKVPLLVRAGWGPMVEGYLTAPRDLRALVLLVDIRRDPGVEEVDFLAWLDRQGLGYLVIVTKADKVSRGKRAARAAAIGRDLNLAHPPLVFSALTGEGREDIWHDLLGRCGLLPGDETE